ncbi:MAG: GNAT family N-acetyltransferase, partial [bacterium]|nr:GNAT family N-acetyltransferase [bacterium]
MNIKRQEIKFVLATDNDVPLLRRLVNEAYAYLADIGLNFTGTIQDEEVTRQRMSYNEVYLLHYGEKVIATVSLRADEGEGNGPFLEISQLAAAPSWQKKGFGRVLLDFAEGQARTRGIFLLQLNTAVPAKHLVAMYLGWGFEICEEVQWDGKNYRSYIMEK